MSVLVRYGNSAELTISLDEHQLIGVCGDELDGSENATPQPSSPFVDIEASDFSDALQVALDQPLEFPDLSQTVVAGDQVTIVVEPSVPRAGDIAAAVAERLIAGGVTPEAVTVLHAVDFATTPIRVRASAELVEAGASAPSSRAAASTVTLRTELHDPTDRGKLSFLANTRSGRPVYLNRLVTDSDMVVSIGQHLGPEAWTYRGVFGGIYPTFSDTETQQRYRNAHLIDTDDEAFAKSQQEIELVGWQSGLQVTVRVVPGPSGKAAIVAGETRAVTRRAAEIWNAAWQCRFEERADLVVAALSGPTNQTWQQVGRALAAALAVVEEGGAIALCTELAEPPGKAIEALQKIEDRDTAVAEIRKARPLDAFPALLLDRAQRRARVYLLSDLEPSVVEELGMARIEHAHEVARLAERRRSCIILCHAQNAAPSLA